MLTIFSQREKGDIIDHMIRELATSEDTLSMLHACRTNIMFADVTNFGFEKSDTVTTIYKRLAAPLSYGGTIQPTKTLMHCNNLLLSKIPARIKVEEKNSIITAYLLPLIEDVQIVIAQLAIQSLVLDHYVHMVKIVY